MKRILALVLVLSALGLARGALACSCIGRTTQQYYDQVQAVFVGEVLQVKEYGERYGTKRAKRAQFKVLNSWKGPRAKQSLWVDGGLADGLCGVDFQKGRQYLIFSSIDRSNLWRTSICSGTKGIKSIEGVIEELQNMKREPLE